MISTEEYNNNRIKYCYDLFKQNKLFIKVRAVIVKDKKLIVLKDFGKKINRQHLIGGGVNDGEKLEDAIIREIKEESGLNAKIEFMLCENHFSIPMSYEGEKFLSKRKEYIYLCSYESGVINKYPIGENGEFNNDIKIIVIDLNELKFSRINKKNKQKIINFIKNS